MFLYPTKLFPPFKTKSAPTEVSAPKNANPNCRQTNFKQIIRIFRRIIKHLDGICDFTKIHDSVLLYAEKRYSIPYKKRQISLCFAFMKFVWQVHCIILFPFCKAFLAKKRTICKPPARKGLITPTPNKKRTHHFRILRGDVSNILYTI